MKKNPFAPVLSLFPSTLAAITLMMGCKGTTEGRVKKFKNFLNSGMPGMKMSKRILWVNLLKRIFSIDVLVCSRCKNRTSLVGVVCDPQTIQVTLTAMGLSPRPPRVAPARRTGLWGMHGSLMMGLESKPRLVLCRTVTELRRIITPISTATSIKAL